MIKETKLYDHSRPGIFTLISEHVRDFLSSHNNSLCPPDLYNTIIEEAEKAVLQEVIVYSHGNQMQAAKILGINRNTLKRKLDYYRISFHSKQQ